ncbi:CHAT domain-containing tetratricopeptide repeat protein [Leptothermofonsia sp. ETS-13]|uniref:CHAT domain-containing tetratricopeptide repeat protein n=1 Tax=Leptothermofonsia sp. ETS-13 TaxID=3035696 RepID=UPI003B9F05CA
MPRSSIALTILAALLSNFIFLPSRAAISDQQTQPTVPHPFPVPSSNNQKLTTSSASSLPKSSQQAEADRLLEQGIQQWRASQYQESLQSLQQALTLFRKLNDQPKQVKILRNLGNVYYLQSNYDQAVSYYQQSLDLARTIQDRAGEAGALGNLGVVAAGLGDYRKAGKYYEQALPIYRQVYDRLGEGQTLGNLGEVAYGLGDYPQAIAYLQQTLTIARELKDRQLESNTLGTLGIVHYSLSDYSKAIEYNQQQLATARELKDRRSEAAALNNIANSYHAQGDYGTAIAFHEQRLVISREIGDRIGEAHSLKNLSSIYYDLGNYSEAIQKAFDSLAIARAIKNRAAEASVMTNIGNLYLVLQDYPKAIEYHQQRLAIAQEMGDLSGTGTALINLGNAHKRLGQIEKSVEFYQQALTIARKLQDRGQESSCLLNLGIVYDDLGQYGKATEYHQQALAIVRQTKDRATEAYILNNLGNTQFKAGNLAAAEATLTAGLHIWESLRANLGTNDFNKISIFEQQARTYRLLQRVLVAQNKTTAALEIAERGRARAFVELLSRRLASPSQTASAISSTAAASPSIAQMQQIARTQNSTLVQYSITYEDVIVNGRAEARETKLYIWAIAPNGTISFRKVDLKPLWQQQKISLSDLVATSRETLGLRGRGLAVVASREGEPIRQQHSRLYELLVQPIADVLPKDPNARVTFIPQGVLFLVPFAALKTPSNRFLIEQHTILTAPSIQVLELTQQLRNQKRGRSSFVSALGRRNEPPSTRPPIHPSPLTPHSALVVGNPTMPKVPALFNRPAEQLESLPGAEREANAIAPLLGTQALTGDLATKAAIVKLMPQQQIIHLATHGLLDDFKGLGIPGAIALAPSGKDNGLLTADEILNLKLKAELVVLSACNTGRGRITGDGVIGLSRSFITAGVPSIIVSLWAVPDSPTASLMTEFYQVLKRNPDKAQALRQAMLTTMQQYPNPRDWAAFSLIGEAE